MNLHWPDDPISFADRDRPRNVRVRIVWADGDGGPHEEYLSGMAIRWDSTHVYVQISNPDERLPTQGVWVKPGDVYQASPTGGSRGAP